MNEQRFRELDQAWGRIEDRRQELEQARMKFWKVWIRSTERDSTLSYEMVAAYNDQEAAQNVNEWLKENQIPAYIERVVETTL